MEMGNPANPDGPKLCAHVYDEIGCTYNTFADCINVISTLCDSNKMIPTNARGTLGAASPPKVILQGIF